jgi:hypothetical protein
MNAESENLDVSWIKTDLVNYCVQDIIEQTSKFKIYSDYSLSQKDNFKSNLANQYFNVIFDLLVDNLIDTSVQNNNYDILFATLQGKSFEDFLNNLAIVYSFNPQLTNLINNRIIRLYLTQCNEFNLHFDTKIISLTTEI